MAAQPVHFFTMLLNGCSKRLGTLVCLFSTVIVRKKEQSCLEDERAGGARSVIQAQE